MGIRSVKIDGQSEKFLAILFHFVNLIGSSSMLTLQYSMPMDGELTKDRPEKQTYHLNKKLK